MNSYDGQMVIEKDDLEFWHCYMMHVIVQTCGPLVSGRFLMTMHLCTLLNVSSYF